jgi:hypothetical protein
MAGEDKIIKKLVVMDASIRGIQRSEGMIIKKLVEMDASIRNIQENMVTKDELKEARSEIMSHIDGFAKRQEKFDHELVSISARIARVEGTV